MNSVSKFNEFIRGFLTPVRALQLLLDHPDLIGLFILPMALTLVTLSVVIYVILTGIWSLSHEWIETFFHPAGAGALQILATAILIYFAFLSFHLFIQLFASPFNDLLAERTERALGAPSIPVNWKRLIRVFWLDLRKTGFCIGMGGTLSLLSLMPLLGFLAIPCLAWLQSFIFLTYPLSRREMGLFGSLHWIKTHPGRTLGLGLALLIIFSIPVVNLFALPLAVMCGTLCFLDQ